MTKRRFFMFDFKALLGENTSFSSTKVVEAYSTDDAILTGRNAVLTELGYAPTSQEAKDVIVHLSDVHEV
jgi:hypothetical protein